MKRFLLKILLPWSITLLALYWAFKGIDFSELWSHLTSAKPGYIAAAVLLTGLSYILRGYRWRYLFPQNRPPFVTAWQVLVLGFFMNNILPARAGELVRAHLGGKLIGERRTLVLATIASERLADGVTISAMFAGCILFLGRGQLDPKLAQNLLYVAYLFGGVCLSVIVVLSQRERIFQLLDTVAAQLNHRASTFGTARARLFIEGLSPLCVPAQALRIAVWSLIIWAVELGVFWAVAFAFNSPLSLSAVVVFLVVVNFTSLIPAAPGGFGTIELLAKQALLSVGVGSPALALGMVLTQHFIQYAVIGIPGAWLLLRLSSLIREVQGDIAVAETA